MSNKAKRLAQMLERQAHLLKELGLRVEAIKAAKEARQLRLLAAVEAAA